MTGLRLALLLAALPVCSIGPGLLALRSARLDPVERLAAACGISFVALYLVTGAAYLLRLPPSGSWVVTAACLAALVACRRDLAGMARSVRARRVLAGWGLALLWAGLLLASVRCYSGALWSRDHVEHFERTLFFLQRGEPLAARFLDGIYLLPARPPLMNILASHFLALSGPSFAALQITFSFLNSIALVSCALLLPHLARRGSAAVPVLVCLLVLNPSFVENVTLPWTKLLSAFFVVAGTAFYLRGRLARSGLRLSLAFLFLAAGSLVHYGAAVFLVLAGSHAMFTTARAHVGSGGNGRDEARGRMAVRRLAAALLLALLLLATWFSWSVAVFGVRATMAANTTVEGYGLTTAAGNILKVGRNLIITAIPHFLRPQAPMMGVLQEQPSSWGRLRDFWFLPYQVNFPTALGTAGGIVALGCFLGVLRGQGAPWRRRGPRAMGDRARDVPFWAWWVPAGFVLGVAAYGPSDDYGVAHVTLQPLMLVGLAFLAVRLRQLNRVACGLFLFGAGVDLVLGVWLQFWAQSQSIGVWIDSGGVTILNAAGLSGGAVQNAIDKQLWGLVFLGDALGRFRALLLGGIVGFSGAAFVALGSLVLRRRVTTRRCSAA